MLHEIKLTAIAIGIGTVIIAILALVPDYASIWNV